MSHGTRVAVRPVVILVAICVGVPLAFLGVLVRDPYMRGEISATYAVVAWLALTAAFAGPIVLLAVIERKTKGWPGSVLLRRIADALTGAAMLLWIVLVFQTAKDYGVGMPSPCSELLSFRSRMVWFLLFLFMPLGWVVGDKIERARDAEIASAKQGSSPPAPTSVVSVPEAPQRP